MILDFYQQLVNIAVRKTGCRFLVPCFWLPDIQNITNQQPATSNKQQERAHSAEKLEFKFFEHSRNCKVFAISELRWSRSAKADRD